MSELLIRRVAVLGAGTTGGAIAAHLTNLGFSVSLLDTTALSASEGIDHARSTLFIPERASEIRALALDDPAANLDEADWIIEALPERLEIKRDVYARLALLVRPDVVVSTCSSSLPIDELVEGLPDSFGSRFLATVFALPLAGRRLVELRPGSLTDPVLASAMAKFLSEEVARRVVTVPAALAGLIGRYGVWTLLQGVNVAAKLRLDLEDVEAITVRFLGPEFGGIFGSIDGIGLDTVHDIAQNLQTHLPGDRGTRFLTLTDSFVGLLARGWTGDRAGRGFFRREGRDRLALNLTTMAYRQEQVSSLAGLRIDDSLSATESLRGALSGRDEVGEYLREFLIPCLRYAEYLRDVTGASVEEFDQTMEWGFGWSRGPFALLDALGIGASRYYEGNTYLAANGGYLPIHQDTVCRTVSDCPVIERGETYAVHDLGDGILAVALADGVLSRERVGELIALLEGKALGRFVLTSVGTDFPSLDLAFLYEALRSGDSLAADGYLASLQGLGELLESRACVAAIQGRCVGAALGLALSCPVVVATSGTELGFNEGRLGILPAARGVVLMRAIHGESTRKLGEIAVALTEGVIANNPDSARLIGLLRVTDVTEYLPERLLSTAKALALKIEPVGRPSLLPIEGPLLGMIDRGLTDRRTRGGLTDHDVSVGQRIRHVVARTTGYEECVEKERQESIEMGAKALSLARLRHMVEVGKPLRN